MSPRPSRPRRGHLLPALAVTTAVTAGTLVLPLAGAASAHVTVQGPGATQGGYTKLVFRMPTEREVNTTGLEIAFPEEHPITSVRVKPKQGWTYELTRTPLAEPVESHGRQITETVTRIAWTATGEGVGPTEFEEFEVSAGRLPPVDRMMFPALQTYADGEVVRWIEESADGAAEPERPAPVLQLAPATDDEHGGGTTAEPAAADVDGEPVAAVTDDGAGTDPVAVAALVVGLVALAAAGAGLLRRPRGLTTD